MNCEQVEELLSAYLDNALASEDRRQVIAHLQRCGRCSAILADYRRFDALLAQMPRVSPQPTLRDRIFSAPAYLELPDTFGKSGGAVKDQTLPKIPARFPQHDTPGRPQLVAIPGGRSTPAKSSAHAPTQKQRSILLPGGQRRSARRVFATIAALAAALFVLVGVGSLFYVHSLSRQPQTVNNGGGITPPTGPQGNGPLSAGMRFVFLRDGALWSTPVDGSAQAARLTPQESTVSAGWVVSPPLPGHSVGDRLAYIDPQQALVHIIRSDGQQDTFVKQPLFKAGVSPASIWDTEEGMAILSSLTWSPDDSTLAFVADPMGTGQTNLYIYSTDTGTIQQVALPDKGIIAHSVWSPDGVRLAFELTHNGAVSVLDYNVQNRGLLNLAQGVNIQTRPNDGVLSLDWSSDVDAPTVTWSVGTVGRVHSIWEHRVGVGGTAQAQLLVRGDYTQATYSRAGHGGIGSWLLVTSILGHPGDIQRVDLQPGGSIVTLTNGKQVTLAWWSPDGTAVDYLDSIASGVGTLHIVNVTTDTDALIAKGIASYPIPAWSLDSEQLVYSTGTQSFVVDVHGGNKPRLLSLHGPAFAFLWSTTSAHQLIVALGDGHQGMYLVDTQRNTSTQLDKQGMSGELVWTEVP